MRGLLQHPGLYNRDPRLGFSPVMSPLGGREMLDPLARLGRGSPYGIMRGGGLGMGGLSVRGLGVGGLRAGMLGERSLGIQGRELHPGALLGNRGGLGMGIHGDPLSQALQLGRYQGGLQHRHGRHGGLGDLGLMPYRSYLGGGWPHGAECDTCLREQLYHRHQGHYDHGCGCRRSCGESLNSNTKSNFDFKTKDVTVRGKARAVRASYLTEAGKFEADLVKFMDKKSEEEVPDRVVDMLVSFINREEYSNGDLVDEVRLNILASSVGAKSLVEYSLGQLKHSQLPLDGRIICEIITLITQSTKVDDGLRKWLEKELKADGDYLYLQLLNHSAAFEKLWRDRPEAVAEVQRMVGDRPSSNDSYHPMQ